MSYFKHATAKTTVQVLEICVPLIFITKKALAKMQLFIENCSEEVGWLGTAKKEGKFITIEDMYLFDQEVHSTTTEITPEGLGIFAEKLLQEENGMEVWNNLKVWGHSHVRMGVTPSGQDNKQMETFAEGGHDWFIRIIGNKNGDMKLDLYDYSQGIIYENIPWGELRSAEEETIAKRIAELQALLSNVEKQSVTQFEAAIKTEIQEKVKKKSYTNQYKSQAEPGKCTTYKTTTENTTTESTTDKKKEESTTNGTKTQRKDADDEEIYTSYIYAVQDILDADSDVYSYFTQMDLLDVAECVTQKEVEEVIGSLGYDDFFSYNDVLQIKRVASNLMRHMYYERSY